MEYRQLLWRGDRKVQNHTVLFSEIPRGSDPLGPAHISLARARHLPTPNVKGVGKAVLPCGQRKCIRISATPTNGHCTDLQGVGACGWGRELSTCCQCTRQKLREAGGEEPYKAGAGAWLMVGIRVQTETSVRAPSMTRVGG